MKNFITAFLLALIAFTGAQAQTNNAVYHGTAPLPAPSSTTPIWAKLVVAGNVVTAYYATGAGIPTTWTQIGDTATMNFTNNPLLIGIFLTSHNAAAVSTGTIDNLSISPDSTYRLADTDIGAPSLMGSANLISGVWNLSGSGADVWGTSDQFNFQPWLIWGDCTIICRITGLTATGDSWQKIGLMVRDSYNSGSAYAAFCATLRNGVSFQYRTASNANPDATMMVAPTTPGSTASTTVGYQLSGPSAYVLRP